MSLSKIFNLLKEFFYFNGWGSDVFYLTDRKTVAPASTQYIKYSISQGKEYYLKNILIKQFSTLSDFEVSISINGQAYPIYFSNDFIIVDDDLIDVDVKLNKNDIITLKIENKNPVLSLDIYTRIKGYITK